MEKVLQNNLQLSSLFTTVLTYSFTAATIHSLEENKQGQCFILSLPHSGQVISTLLTSDQKQENI